MHSAPQLQRLLICRSLNAKRISAQKQIGPGALARPAGLGISHVYPHDHQALRLDRKYIGSEKM